MKPKTSSLLIISIILILAFAFYWFDLRVAQIRKNCVKNIATQEKNVSAQDFKDWLKVCLYKYGIKE